MIPKKGDRVVIRSDCNHIYAGKEFEVIGTSIAGSGSLFVWFRTPGKMPGEMPVLLSMTHPVSPLILLARVAPTRDATRHAPHDR